MNTGLFKISTLESISWLAKDSSNPRGQAKALIKFLHGMAGGTYRALLQASFSDAAVAASATVTAASVLAADTASINTQTFTAQDLREIRTILCVADSAGSLNSTWFK